MAAKPILDIVAAVRDGVAIDEVVGRLGAMGADGDEGYEATMEGPVGGAPGSRAPCTSTSWEWAVRYGWTIAVSIAPGRRQCGVRERDQSVKRNWHSSTPATVGRRPRGRARGSARCWTHPGAVDGGTGALIRTYGGVTD